MLSYVVMALALVAMAAAAPATWYPWPGFPYHHGYPYGGYGYQGYYGYDHGYNPYVGHAPAHYGGKLAYYGDLKGSCEGARDGLYYVDQYSFAYCSNGQQTIQACADGSANPEPSYFHPGNYYGFYDFCAVNLVAKGYNGHPGEPEYEHKGAYVETEYKEEKVY